MILDKYPLSPKLVKMVPKRESMTLTRVGPKFEILTFWSLIAKFKQVLKPKDCWAFCLKICSVSIFDWILILNLVQTRTSEAKLEVLGSTLVQIIIKNLKDSLMAFRTRCFWKENTTVFWNTHLYCCPWKSDFCIFYSPFWDQLLFMGQFLTSVLLH